MTHIFLHHNVTFTCRPGLGTVNHEALESSLVSWLDEQEYGEWAEWSREGGCFTLTVLAGESELERFLAPLALTGFVEIQNWTALGEDMPLAVVYMLRDGRLVEHTAVLSAGPARGAWRFADGQLVYDHAEARPAHG
jgi:hypothetical protein